MDAREANTSTAEDEPLQAMYPGSVATGFVWSDLLAAITTELTKEKP